MFSTKFQRSKILLPDMFSINNWKLTSKNMSTSPSETSLKHYQSAQETSTATRSQLCATILFSLKLANCSLYTPVSSIIHPVYSILDRALSALLIKYKQNKKRRGKKKDGEPSLSLWKFTGSVGTQCHLNSSCEIIQKSSSSPSSSSFKKVWKTHPFNSA